MVHCSQGQCWSIIGIMANETQFKLRLPEDLKQKLEGAARRSKRSITAIIIDRLEISFQPNEAFEHFVYFFAQSLGSNPAFDAAQLLEGVKRHSEVTARLAERLLVALQESSNESRPEGPAKPKRSKR